MRNFITVSVLAISALTLGCGSGKDKPAAQPMDSGKVVDSKTCVMPSGGHGVLSVTATPDITCTPKDGQLTLKSHTNNQVDIWLISGATSLDDAAAKIPDQIKSEFKDFKLKSTTEATVAGNPARRMTGTGTEADDGDAGSAEVVLFKAGDHIFVACIHGERIPADEPEWMMTLLKTAKAP